MVAQVFSASRMRIKLIARIMAEGVRDIFSLLHAAIALLDAHLKALAEAQKMQHAQERHHMDVAETAVGLVATAANQDAKAHKNRAEKTDV